VPLVGALRKKLWEISFPGDPFEESSSLPDLYQTARTRHPQKLSETMIKSFTVDPKMLQANIALRGSKDLHSYHILGSNMLQWVRTGIPSLNEKKMLLESMLRTVRDGRQKHPKNNHLRDLEKDLESEKLGLALIKRERSPLPPPSLPPPSSPPRIVDP
jgi:hypothetical protein